MFQGIKDKLKKMEERGARRERRVRRELSKAVPNSTGEVIGFTVTTSGAALLKAIYTPATVTGMAAAGPILLTALVAGTTYCGGIYLLHTRKDRIENKIKKETKRVDELIALLDV